MELWSVVRWVRVVGFSAVCAGLASAGHVAAGGMVHRQALAMGFVVLLLPALALTGRERTLRTILPALGAAQVFLHLLLAQTGPEHGAEHPMPMPGMRMPAEQHDPGSSGLSMLLMHLVAVIVTAWWLERGEAGLCGLVRQVASWLMRPLRPIRTIRCTRATHLQPVSVHRVRVSRDVLQYVLARRGPPVGTVAFD